MVPLPRLTQHGEEAWLRLKHHLEWCDHFALAFIFTAHSEVIHVFRERLAGIYRARITRMHTPIPAHPSLLFSELLPKLLHPPIHEQSLNAPYWIDLSSQHGPEWEKARLDFLIRLNEQREALRKALPRPLLLVLPLGEFSRIKELVPDLWAIRDFSLKTEPWVMPEENRPAEKTRETDLYSKDFLSEYDHSLIREWERLQHKDTHDRGVFIAGMRAFQVCINQRDYKQAFGISEKLLHYSKKQIDEKGETPESLRDLSVSLDNVGDTAKAMGQWEKAEQSFKEGLSIAMPLSGLFTNHPAYTGLADHFKQRLETLHDDRDQEG